MKIKRVFLIVLDSFGIGDAPDADLFGDLGVNTYKSVSLSPYFTVPTLNALGLSKIVGESQEDIVGCYGKCTEKSNGKDTVIGHWEIAGLISPTPFPTYPNGFPKEIMDLFCEKTGKGVLCNQPYSGTDVIRDFGKQHLQSGDLIVYTSADSVFQIAAHERKVPLRELYHYCEIARDLLQGKWGVGRVIARPFGGEFPNFVRLAGRHDYSISPPKTTVLETIKAEGKQVIGVGKISDIFAGVGITESFPTADNDDGMKITKEIAKRDFEGICFTNLVDFDAKFGHRRDVDGYAKALSSFDLWLSGFLKDITSQDLLIITADHGCDPLFKGTDHTRERVPLLVYNPLITPIDLGSRSSFADIGATIADILNINFATEGKSFKSMII